MPNLDDAGQDCCFRIGVVIWKVISMHACIKADARAKYRDVKEVLDGARSAGVEKIGILVDQRKAAVVPD